MILRFDRLLEGGRWRRDVLVRVDEEGRIRSRAPADGGDGSARIPGWTVPGVPNVHSHAFQRAMAGLAEGGGRTGRRTSSFWRWREVMYRFLERISPDDIEAVAAQLYVEMLKAGFTCVGEFHYLHRPPGGGAYDDEAETSRRILRAATQAGIGLVHMPVVYETGGFAAEPLKEGQRRFQMELEGVVRLREALGPDLGGAGEGSRSDHDRAGRRLGWAVHSLRAVSSESFARIADFLESSEGGGPSSSRESPSRTAPSPVAPASEGGGPSSGRESPGAQMQGGRSPRRRSLGAPRAGRSPVHIHVAEQEREVRECLAARGARPVEWLLDNAPVDDRWCLVHATRVADSEVRGIAASRAVVGLCPTTEANLGDGLFPLASFVGCGGRFGIGTDSHVSRSPVEELRLLDYGQRLVLRTRSTAAHEGAPDSAASGRNVLAGPGGALLDRAWRHGAQALAWDGGQATVGRRADFVVLDADHPALVGRDGRAVLDSWVFSGTDSPVRHVFVGGVQVIEDGRHPREEEIARAFGKAARRLGPVTNPSGP